MKRFMMFLAGLLLLMTCVTITSCKNSVPYGLTLTEESVDSIVHSQVMQTINPVFTSVDGVLVYRDLNQEENRIDSIFNVLPEQVLKNVATVCINRDKTTSKRAIVSEYLSNSTVYNNLLPHTSTQTILSTDKQTSLLKQDTTITPVDEVSYAKYDTVIGEKSYKIHIKQEKRYENQ